MEKRAKEICGEEDIFLRDKIEIAPLRISTVAPDSDRLGHFHYRYDMVEFYNQDSEGTISHSELFTEAKSFAELNSESFSTSEARARHILSKGNMVFVAGQAGIGKTTFTKLLVKEMLDPEIPSYNAEVVFFFRFRDVNYKRETDLLQFLTTGASIMKHYNKKKRKKILEKLDKCENLYIVMDGLDEAIISNNANVPSCEIDSQETAEIFIKNLLCGNILPRSKKIITSRPRQLNSLPEECRSKFVVNIQGLYDEGQEQICRNLCGDDTVRHNLIIGHINSRPDLKSYCHVPINCILIMLSFSKMDKTEWKNIVSLTSILVTALDEWFLKKLKGNFQIQEISQLAYKGFVKDRYYFEEWHLKKAGVNFNNTTTFLTNNFKFKLLNGSEIVSYFAHLMWQELFVAVKIRFYISKNDFVKLISNSDLSSDKFEVVTRFLFGLCNKQTRRKLLGHANIEALSLSMDSKEFKKTLKDFAIKLLKKFYEKTSSSPGSEIEEFGDEDLNFAADDVSTDHENDIVGAAVFHCNDDCSFKNACGSNSVAGSDIVTIRHDEVVSDATDFQTSSHNAAGDNDIVPNTDNDTDNTIHDKVEDHNVLDSHSDAICDCDAISFESNVADDNGCDNFSRKNREADDKANIVHELPDNNDASDADGKSESIDHEQENDVNNDDDSGSDISEDEEMYFSNILPVLQWVFEMRDNDFTKQVASCLRNEIIISQMQILPTEIPCMNHVLRARKSELIVKLIEPSFSGDCAEYFIDELDITLKQNSNIQVSVFFYYFALVYALAENFVEISISLCSAK